MARSITQKYNFIKRINTAAYSSFYSRYTYFRTSDKFHQTCIFYNDGETNFFEEVPYSVGWHGLHTQHNLEVSGDNVINLVFRVRDDLEPVSYYEFFGYNKAETLAWYNCIKNFGFYDNCQEYPFVDLNDSILLLNKEVESCSWYFQTGLKYRMWIAEEKNLKKGEYIFRSVILRGNRLIEKISGIIYTNSLETYCKGEADLILEGELQSIKWGNLFNIILTKCGNKGFIIA